jgi:hypothetical protein
MATRSIVRIIPSKATEQKDCSDVALRYICLYHHWDGSPSGVGRELEHFLRGRNDGDAPDGTPTWDADRIRPFRKSQLTASAPQRGVI